MLSAIKIKNKIKIEYESLDDGAVHLWAVCVFLNVMVGLFWHVCVCMYVCVCVCMYVCVCVCVCVPHRLI